MQRVKAFLTALLLFLVTVCGCHIYIRNQADVHSGAFGTYASEKKGKLRQAVTKNMGENSFPVFGSSEFQHGVDTPFHPSRVFAGSDVSPMLIGAGYYQSLSHAVTLASIEDSMQVRKAALILSPQWFRKDGVLPQAYASRFSETHYAGAMANDDLSDEQKEYISERTQKLLKVDPKTQKRVLLYDAQLWRDGIGEMEELYETAWSAFLTEKELFETNLMRTSRALRESERAWQEAKGKGEPDWNALMELAERQGEEENTNPFYMDNTAYKRLEPHLEAKEGMNADAVKGYQKGPEFDDLECFLKTCADLKIKPMLVMIPVNGYYYDYTGFPKEAREAYYEKIRWLAEKYAAELADFSDQEYTKYFFEDRVHIGKKGWVMVNESLYRFYKED